ncbi:glycosyltransferase [Actinomadura madurae]|nr:glycosyltransferase [Actinomadura madurae]MCP9951223.1 glycosyltransferase [Actinomadura madurae]
MTAGRAGDRDVAVVTPWYPNPTQVWAGSFVQAMVEATAPGCGEVTVYHTEAWLMNRPREEVEAAREAHRRLLPVALHPALAVAGARLLRVPVPTVPDYTFADLAREHASWLREALGGEPIPAPVVHAHVGLRGGWTALENARPDARVFVTEHASFLDKVLAQPDSLELYEQVLERCTGFFVVTDVLRDRLAEAFPALAGKIEMISNPISFAESRPRPVTGLRRWLYVGTLVERKGVGLLVEAFATCHAEDPGLTLTIAGAGGLARPARGAGGRARGRPRGVVPRRGRLGRGRAAHAGARSPRPRGPVGDLRSVGHRGGGGRAAGARHPVRRPGTDTRGNRDRRRGNDRGRGGSGVDRRGVPQAARPLPGRPRPREGPRGPGRALRLPHGRRGAPPALVPGGRHGGRRQGGDA